MARSDDGLERHNLIPPPNARLGPRITVVMFPIL
jgi:hypothetical protein